MTDDQRRILIEQVAKVNARAIALQEEVGRLWLHLEAGSNEGAVLRAIAEEAKAEIVLAAYGLDAVRDLLGAIG